MATSIEKISILKDTDLGGQLNPISNNDQLRKAILGRRNCKLYTKGTFKLTEDIVNDLRIRNIKLIGLAFACLPKKIETEILNDISKMSPKKIIEEVEKNIQRNISGNFR